MKSVFKNKFEMLTLVAFVATTNFAIAQGGDGKGLRYFFRSMQETFKEAVPFFEYAFFAIGILLFGLVGMDFWKRSQQSGGQKPEMSHILYKIIGGVVCVAIGTVANFSKESLLEDNETIQMHKITLD